MVSNAVTKVELYGEDSAGDIRGWDCASGTLISKGTILTFSSARTAIAASSAAQIFAGVSSADKSASDYSTRTGCWENGILEMYCSGVGVAGMKVVTDADNKVRPASNTDVTSSRQLIVGVLLKSATNARTQVRVLN